MKPRRTHFSNTLFALVGGNEDNDLWAERTIDADGHPVVKSVWQPSKEERQALAEGHSLYLVVWGENQPPVAIGVTDEPLGKPLTT